MDSSTVVNLLAVVMAAVAAVVSSRALRLVNHANQLPVVVDLIANSRDAGFMRKEDSVWESMASVDPGLGFQNLPEPLKGDAFEVGQYYQCIAYLCVHGIADFDVIGPQVGYRATRTWEAIQPHVESERRMRGGPNTFFNSFEMFVADVATVDFAAVDEMAVRKRRRLRRTGRLRRR